MKKSEVLAAIIAELEKEFAKFERASNDARNAATDGEAKAEGKYDTRSTEAGYLADGQARQADRAAQALVLFRGLNSSDVSDTSIRLGSLFSVRRRRVESWYFMGPAAGGLSVQCNGREVVVVTPVSPLGSAADRKMPGDSVEGGIVGHVW